MRLSLLALISVLGLNFAARENFRLKLRLEGEREAVRLLVTDDVSVCGCKLSSEEDIVGAVSIGTKTENIQGDEGAFRESRMFGVPPRWSCGDLKIW